MTFLQPEKENDIRFLPLDKETKIGKRVKVKLQRARRLKLKFMI